MHALGILFSEKRETDEVRGCVSSVGASVTSQFVSWTPAASAIFSSTTPRVLLWFNLQSNADLSVLAWDAKA